MSQRTPANISYREDSSSGSETESDEYVEYEKPRSKKKSGGKSGKKSGNRFKRVKKGRVDKKKPKAKPASSSKKPGYAYVEVKPGEENKGSLAEPVILNKKLRTVSAVAYYDSDDSESGNELPPEAPTRTSSRSRQGKNTFSSEARSLKGQTGKLSRGLKNKNYETASLPQLRLELRRFDQPRILLKQVDSNENTPLSHRFKKKKSKVKKEKPRAKLDFEDAPLSTLTRRRRKSATKSVQNGVPKLRIVLDKIDSKTKPVSVRLTRVKMPSLLQKSPEEIGRTYKTRTRRRK